MRILARAIPVAAVVLALSLAGQARADKGRIHLTAAGQAAARATVVTRKDLGTLGAWTGGARKPDLSQTSPCPSFRPKQADLVLNGAAQTRWRSAGIQIDSTSQVLATDRMVALDWQRSVTAPQLIPCLRSAFAKEIGSSGRLVSLRRVAFPKLARHTAAMRAVLKVNTSNGAVRVLTDLILLGAGRTELVLTVTAPLAGQATIRQAEIRLATVLVSRIRL